MGRMIFRQTTKEGNTSYYKNIERNYVSPGARDSAKQNHSYSFNGYYIFWVD